MKAIIFDTETTGAIASPGKPISIVEAAWLEASLPGSPGPGGREQFSQRYMPMAPISFGAMAVHHILPEDLLDCPPASEFRLPPVDFVIGHNIDFDMAAIGPAALAPGTTVPPRRICTLAMSRTLWPDCDSHSLSALTYMLAGTERAAARDRLRNAHSALADCELCRDLLAAIVDRAGIVHPTWESLWQFSEQCHIPRTMPFGKHKGLAIKDVPPDYRAWLLRQPDIDPYLVQAFRQSLPANRPAAVR